MKRRLALTLCAGLEPGQRPEPCGSGSCDHKRSIIVGNGTVINQGAIVVRGGRIASVSASPQTLPGSNG